MSRLEVVLQNAGAIRGGKKVLRDISWEIRGNEHWAVLGGNGAGKSTLLSIAAGIGWPCSGSYRRYILDGVDQESPIGVRDHIRLLSPDIQDRYGRMGWNPTVRNLVRAGFGETIYPPAGLGPEQEQAAVDVLDLLLMTRFADRRFATLSTGEARKALLARTLVTRPLMLILDECAQALDGRARAGFLDLVDRIARERGTRILWTSHRDREMPGCVHKALVLEQGRAVFKGRKGDAPSIGNTSFLVETGEIEAALPKQGGKVPAVEIRSADVTISGNPVLTGIDLCVAPGQHWGIFGKNGAGKSTLLRLILGEVHPRPGGTVLRFGKGEGEPLHPLRERMGVVSPALQAVYSGKWTVEDIVISGLFGSVGVYQKAGRDALVRARMMAERCGVGELLDRRAETLSYGQLRAALVARALVGGPELLILDEPFVGLSGPWRAGLERLLKELARGGVQIVVASHHPGSIRSFVTHGLVLCQGRIADTGQAADVFSGKAFREVFGQDAG
ncbi:MAG TPA: ATP-binding cassette domain-containing protein [Desulfomicrobiaceae bacterium]|nr:ATP-binding cassette domain-containing protein [Desulfomicrobiaceae bacterium]